VNSWKYILTTRPVRRNGLLRFVDAVDRDRYEALRPFLGLEDFGKMEDVLKETRDQAKRNLQSAEAKLATMRTVARTRLGFGETDEVDASSVLREVNTRLTLQGFSSITSLSQVEQARADVELRLRNLGDTTKTSVLVQAEVALRDVETTIPNADILRELALAQRTRRKVEQQVRGVFYADVLSQGIRWLQESDDARCPLCEQPVDKASLISRLEERLSQNQELQDARLKLDAAIVSLDTALGSFISAANKARTLWSQLGLRDEDWPFVPQEVSAASAIQTLREKRRDADVAELIAVLSPLSETACAAAKHAAWRPVTAHRQRLPGEDQVSAVAALSAILAWVQTEYAQYEAVVQETVEARTTGVRCEQVYDLAVEARKQASLEAFREVAGEVNRIYGRIHPGEPLGNFLIEIKEAGTGSAVILGDYASRHREDPRAYYSDAHLDTLGLSIFLALRKRASLLTPDFRLIVLDDVITSVDGPHRQRIADYLISELSRDYQLIITTHNRQWYEWLLRHENTEGARGRFANLDIVDWSLESGPLIQDPLRDYDYLVRNRASARHEHLVPVAGRLLETVLQQLRFTLELAVPAKPRERYTIGDIWPKFRSESKRYVGFGRAIELECMELDDTWIVRNWGTHGSPEVPEMTRQEAMQLVNPILSLYEKVVCSECAHVVEIAQVPKGAIACRCGHLTYLPDLRPGIKPGAAQMSLISGFDATGDSGAPTQEPIDSAQ